MLLGSNAEASRNLRTADFKTRCHLRLTHRRLKTPAANTPRMTLAQIGSNETLFDGGGHSGGLCLPFIRLIGSRRAPQVLVMKPTNARDAHHPALARPLHNTRLGCVFSQG
jgi:hypothetical protein